MVLVDASSSAHFSRHESGRGRRGAGYLFEDVICALGVFSMVPLRFHLTETEAGGIAGSMAVIHGPGCRLIRDEDRLPSRAVGGDRQRNVARQRLMSSSLWSTRAGAATFDCCSAASGNG